MPPSAAPAVPVEAILKLTIDKTGAGQVLPWPPPLVIHGQVLPNRLPTRLDLQPSGCACK
jgi:hypothetical protein